VTDAEFTAQRELAAALAGAVEDTRAVGKHGDGQGYKYARAEDVMREADRVLSAAGISVVPISAKVAVAGNADSKNGPKAIFVLTCRWLVVHRSGGSFEAEMSIAVGTNLAATPPQATSSAYTCCERDMYRALLRMPRGPMDDVEHPSNNRTPRDEEPGPPAQTRVPPPAARKINRVLPMIDAAKTLPDFERVRDRWNEVLAVRGRPGPDGGAPSDEGYSDADVETIRAALKRAAERVGAA